MQTADTITPNNSVITPEQLFTHWQEHRRLTRKVIAAYPDEHFFTYAIGGMRPFAHLLLEITDLAEAGIQGIVTGKWKSLQELSHVSGNHPQDKAAFLKWWDEVTELIDKLSPQIDIHRFSEKIRAFGMYEGTVCSTLLYLIDNEIHHRGQAYVYLRSLGIEPPAFWDRS
ncbi:damage-inducible protein DinB [Mucilaginibacter sp. Bleaf8]|uniref:DinB family protein n=1 Tax=Mucilaginibacter sp. Bleaf8 TaxID=2834430 RepID=UPI001BCFACD0|nr:DinB family protein [Mucilaginibacter sp. Bleaf8]MBS7563453.1 damage-inducible protein DinB [Mucilaginibacter sp. Bleaf8]